MKEIIIGLLALLSFNLAVKADDSISGKWFNCAKQEQGKAIGQFFLINDNEITYSSFEHNNEKCLGAGVLQGIQRGEFENLENGSIKVLTQADNAPQIVRYKVINHNLLIDLELGNIKVHMGRFIRLD